jgi:hypothetical protein
MLTYVQTRVGRGRALDHPTSPAQAPAPMFRGGVACARSPIYVFTIPILVFTMSDPGVHLAPIHAFTFHRSGRSPLAATRTRLHAG